MVTLYTLVQLEPPHHSPRRHTGCGRFAQVAGVQRPSAEGGLKKNSEMPDLQLSWQKVCLDVNQNRLKVQKFSVKCVKCKKIL